MKQLVNDRKCEKQAWLKFKIRDNDTPSLIFEDLE